MRPPDLTRHVFKVPFADHPKGGYLCFFTEEGALIRVGEMPSGEATDWHWFKYDFTSPQSLLMYSSEKFTGSLDVKFDCSFSWLGDGFKMSFPNPQDQSEIMEWVAEIVQNKDLPEWFNAEVAAIREEFIATFKIPISNPPYRNPTEFVPKVLHKVDELSEKAITKAEDVTSNVGLKVTERIEDCRLLGCEIHRPVIYRHPIKFFTTRYYISHDTIGIRSSIPLLGFIGFRGRDVSVPISQVTRAVADKKGFFSGGISFEAGSRDLFRWESLFRHQVKATRLQMLIGRH